MSLRAVDHSLQRPPSLAEQQLAGAAIEMEGHLNYLVAFRATLPKADFFRQLILTRGQALFLRRISQPGIPPAELVKWLTTINYIFNMALPAIQSAYPDVSERRALQVLCDVDFNLANIRDDDVNLKPLSVWDFCPINSWEVYQRGGTFRGGTKQWIVDSNTGNLYLNDTPETVRYKCALLLLGTPLLQGGYQIFCIARGIFHILTLYYFRWDVKDCSSRCFETLKDLGRIVLYLSLVPLLLFELSALYGLLNPLDGRKLYASFDRLFFGEDVFTFAPCFRPLAHDHFFGGDIDERDVY